MAENEIERCGVCGDWSPPILHTHLDIRMPGQRVSCGPYCGTCQEKAVAVLKKKGWRYRVIEPVLGAVQP